MSDGTTIKQRLRTKYRVAVIKDNTLGEVLHVRLSLLNLLVAFVAILVLTLGLFSFLILVTPLRNYLPGYNENLKEQLALETYRVDSLQEQMRLQTNYLNIVHSVVAGEVQLDSVPTQPDSILMESTDALLTATFPETDAFIAQFEEKGRDNLLLFDATSIQPVHTLFRPAHGVITQAFSPIDKRYGIAMQTPVGENVTSVLSGTIIYETYVIYEGWTIMVQHDGDYLSMYQGVEKPMKQVGATVLAGETLGLVTSDTKLQFQLWQHGNAINPEEVIVF